MSIQSRYVLVTEEAVYIKLTHKHDPTEAPSGGTYAAIGLGILGTLVVVVVVLDLATIQRFIAMCK